MGIGPIILANVGVVAGLYIGGTAPNVFVEIIGVAIAIGAVVCGYRWWESQKEVRRLLDLYQQHRRDRERLLEMWRRERGEITPSESVEPSDQRSDRASKSLPGRRPLRMPWMRSWKIV